MLKFFKKNKEEKPSLQSNGTTASTGAFYPLVVKEVRRETKDAVSVAFELNDEQRSVFRYTPGQYLTFRAAINGEEVRRSYSICAAPHEGELRVAIKEIEGGKFSTYANRTLKAGDALESMAPAGNFAWKHEGSAAHVVGWAAGSGITPISAIAKSVLNSDNESTFTLFYGNKNSNSIIFKNELEDLKNAYVDRFEVHHVLSREDQGSDYTSGRLDADKVKGYNGKFFDVATTTGHFLCGPLGMIEGVSGVLESLGTAKSTIHFELFNTAGATAEAIAKSSSKASANAKVTVVLDGEETHFEMGPKDYVIDAALDAGADVPYACKGAVCCTCRAKVLKGTAEMVMNYALVDDEVNDGYVLTCQTHATSDELVISFDE
ncbi:MAG: 1,2-phenylacetyl-CoA epoxidase, subunit E [Flavobacteriales bacterium UBA4585]|nr:MAG: 1,2-phenylacetyl-CoA epoxidase, subunit E [Flavobacteriales bacterium UBA4585]